MSITAIWQQRSRRRSSLLTVLGVVEHGQGVTEMTYQYQYKYQYKFQYRYQYKYQYQCQFQYPYQYPYQYRYQYQYLSLNVSVCV